MTPRILWNPEQHRKVLLFILREIYRDHLLREALGFKGGTAAHFFYELPRLSVDLDFDLLASEKEKELYKGVESILLKAVKIEDKFIKANTIFYLLSYQPRARKVKVEIARKPFPNKYGLKNYLGVTMKVMVPEDMFAHKLVALTERGEEMAISRDIFDLWFFFKKDWEVNEGLVELRTGAPFITYLKTAIQTVENFDNKNILQGLGELLPPEQKRWVKTHLKEELLSYLWAKLEEKRE